MKNPELYQGPVNYRQHYHKTSDILAGWSEPQIVVRFWLLAVAFAFLALAKLKLR